MLQQSEVQPHLVLIEPNYKSVEPDQDDLAWFEELKRLEPTGDAVADAAVYDELSNDGAMEGAYEEEYQALLTLVMFYEDASEDLKKYSVEEYPFVTQRAQTELLVLDRFLNHYGVKARTVIEFNGAAQEHGRPVL